MNENEKFLTLEWGDIEEIMLNLAEKVLNSGIRFNVIVGVLRGGWIPARILADLLDINEIGALEVKFYKGIEERRERPVITQPLIIDVKDKNVLIVDDVCDTGKSLQMAINALSLHGPKSIQTAVIYTKPWSTIEPDFYYGRSSKWIIFPWETREVIEEIIHAEYKVYPRKLDDIEQVAQDISKKTGMPKKVVKKIISMVVMNRLIPGDS